MEWSSARSLKRARDIREQLVDMLEKVPNKIEPEIFYREIIGNKLCSFLRV